MKVKYSFKSKILLSKTFTFRVLSVFSCKSKSSQNKELKTCIVYSGSSVVFVEIISKPL